MHGFLISFTAPRIFPRFPDLPAGRVPGRLHAALPRPRSCCLVPAARRARKKPIRKTTEKATGVCSEHTPVMSRNKCAFSVPLHGFRIFFPLLPGFSPPLPGFAGRTGSRTLTRCGTASSALLPCSGDAVCPEKANPEDNRKSNGRVFRTHARHVAEQMCVLCSFDLSPACCVHRVPELYMLIHLPPMCSTDASRFYNRVYRLRPCASDTPLSGFIVGCAGGSPSMRSGEARLPHLTRL